MDSTEAPRPISSPPLAPPARAPPSAGLLLSLHLGPFDAGADLGTYGVRVRRTRLAAGSGPGHHGGGLGPSAARWPQASSLGAAADVADEPRRAARPRVRRRRTPSSATPTTTTRRPPSTSPRGTSPSATPSSTSPPPPRPPRSSPTAARGPGRTSPPTRPARRPIRQRPRPL